MDVDLHACLEGDPEAWATFVDRCTGVVHAAVRRTLHGQGTLEDPVQEVFLRLVKDDYRLLRTYDPARASLATWLTVVARSVALDDLRRRRPRALPLEDHDTAGPAPPAVPTGPEPPLHLLTTRQRLVLRLLFDDGMTVTEAATVLGVEEQTVRSVKHKALNRLRRHFGVDGGDAARPDPRTTTRRP